MSLIAVRVAYDTKILRRFDNPFQLHARIILLLFAFIGCKGFRIRIDKDLVTGLYDTDISNDNKAPWLHKTNRWSTVCRFQQTVQHVIQQRFWQKSAAYISTLADRPVDPKT